MFNIKPQRCQNHGRKSTICLLYQLFGSNAGGLGCCGTDIPVIIGFFKDGLQSVLHMCDFFVLVDYSFPCFQSDCVIYARFYIVDTRRVRDI